MSDKLTNKQERFALNLFQGMSQREAYIEAGYSDNQADNSIDVNASNLANDTKILLRLDELKSKAQSAAILTVKERKETLSQQARGELKDVEIKDYGDKIITKTRTYNPTRAIAELNRMEGIGKLNEENYNVLLQKIVNKLEINEMDYSSLTDDELKLLAYGVEIEE